jgi:PAS domain S-box-containing protein
VSVVRQHFRVSGAFYLAALAGIGAVTALCAPFREALDTTTVALAYLLVVLMVATAWGRRPAFFASLAAVACFNFFFLPPVYSFTISDSQNGVVLAAFLITAAVAGQLSELTRRAAAETEAREADARLANAKSRTLFEASPDALVTVDTDGTIDDANSAIEIMTGRPLAALIGTSFPSHFTEPDQARDAWRETLRDGFVRDWPLELRQADGHLTSVFYSASVRRGDNGRPVGIVAALRPVLTSPARGSIAPDADAVRFVARFVVFASVSSIAVGLLGLAGWVLDIAPLKSVIPGQAVTKPTTTIALVACGCALWLLRDLDDRRPRGARAYAGRTLALLAALLGLARLCDYLFGWSLQPDGMAPITAVNFLLTGLALLWLDSPVVVGSQQFQPAELLAFAINTAASVALLDALLRAEASFAHAAPQTAITQFVLSIAIVCARTGSGVGALIVSRSYGGMLARRLWPATVIVPLLVGTASWKAYSAGLLSEWAAITLTIVVMIALLAGLTVWSSMGIDRSDLERRGARASLHLREEELRDAQRLARVGNWLWRPATDTMAWSEELYRIAGGDPKLPPPRFDEHRRFYTPASFARLAAAVGHATRTGTPFALDLELVRADGVIRLVTTRGEAERDDRGRVALVRGSVQDVTELRHAEQALRASEANLTRAQEIAHIGSWRLDIARDRFACSDEVFRIFDVPADTPMTRDWFIHSVHPADRDDVNRAWKAALHGAGYEIEHRILVGSEVKWVRQQAEVEFDETGRATGAFGAIQDVTERKRAQQELFRLNRALRALNLCNQALIRATDESAWLHEVCDIIVGAAGYRFCWVGRAEHDEAKSVTAVAEAGVDEGFLKAVSMRWSSEGQRLGPTGTSITTGRAQIVADTATDRAYAPWRDEALKRGYGSIIAIPLFVNDEPFGALSICATEAGAFHSEEISLLSELAADLGYGVTMLRLRAEQRRGEEEIRRLNADLEQRVLARTADLEAAREREARVGFKIQQMLLLTQPPTDVPGVQIAALTIPSQRVDGDFYDFFRHDDQCLDVIVADVMGKGVPAALLAAATKSNFLEALCHLIAVSRGDRLPEPKEIVTLAHADMVRQLIDLESFVTLSYVRLDLARRRLELVDCGHTGMLALRENSCACEIVHGDNLPLGIREGEIFDQLPMTFASGDLFLFFSDGLTELRDLHGDWYGVDRLAESVRKHRTLEPRPLVDAIRAEALAFAQSDRLNDDLTCVVVKIVDAERPLAHAELDIQSDLADLGRARAFVREVCRLAPETILGDSEIARLELAVNEAASNIMKHAYHGRRDQRIQLDGEAYRDRVAIRLHHLGDPFELDTAPPPALDGSRESGFGIYLMTNSVSDVRYSRDDRGKHCIALVQNRGA